MLVRPVAPPRNPSVEETAYIPDLDIEMPAAPAPLPTAKIGPARPHVPAPAVNHEAAPEELPETPQIVPQLSARESNALRAETEESLRDAERNVAAALRKRLNPTQSDLASKVKGFIADAREASRAGDWLRARDLAKKAQVLSQELANST